MEATKKEHQLIVSVSPHVRSDETTSHIMWSVSLALLPALLAGLYFFGLKALFVTALCIVSAMFFERLYLKIVDKNIERILPMVDKKCLFSFITWKSYLIIIVMVAMGSLLRHSAIPKHYLAILYTGIGLALILSSLRYLRVFVQELTKI